MDFKSLDLNLISEAANLALENYYDEQKRVDALYCRDYKDVLQKQLSSLFEKQLGVMAFCNSSLIGYLAFSAINDTQIINIKKASSPIYGYGIEKGNDRGKIISLLFQYASEELLSKSVGFFDIKVYAHDTSVLTSYVLNQFGILGTDAIKNIDCPICKNCNNQYDYLEFTKEDITQSKTALLALWNELVEHLRKGPTYWPGIEFTDEVYWNYINDSDTRLFVAKDKEKIIGIMDASQDGNSFANSDANTINVGDLFVLRTYRGQNIAQELLQYVSNVLKAEGYGRLWVEHGTTNPNAQRFWDRYFTRFTYTLTRRIDERIFQCMDKKELRP